MLSPTRLNVANSSSVGRTKPSCIPSISWRLDGLSPFISYSSPSVSWQKSVESLSFTCKVAVGANPIIAIVDVEWLILVRRKARHFFKRDKEAEGEDFGEPRPLSENFVVVVASRGRSHVSS